MDIEPSGPRLRVFPFLFRIADRILKRFVNAALLLVSYRSRRTAAKPFHLH